MQRSGLGHRCLRKRMPMAEYVRGDMVADACGENAGPDHAGLASVIRIWGFIPGE